MDDVTRKRIEKMSVGLSPATKRMLVRELEREGVIEKPVSTQASLAIDTVPTPEMERRIAEAHELDAALRKLSRPKKSRQKKGWSVRDADHIPNGSAVMLSRAPADIIPDIADIWETFGLMPVSERNGVIADRFYQSGSYVVRLNGSPCAISVDRSDFIFPVPEGVVALDPARRRR